MAKKKAARKASKKSTTSSTSSTRKKTGTKSAAKKAPSRAKKTSSRSSAAGKRSCSDLEFERESSTAVDSDDFLAGIDEDEEEDEEELVDEFEDEEDEEEFEEEEEVEAAPPPRRRRTPAAEESPRRRRAAPAEDEAPRRRQAAEADPAPAPAAAAPVLNANLRSLVEPDPGKTVIACVELPGGVLMQWGRSRAPEFGAADMRIEFQRPFTGVPAVTSSFLYERPASMPDRYLLEVRPSGFTWRTYGPLGELMWLAIGPA